MRDKETVVRNISPAPTATARFFRVFLPWLLALAFGALSLFDRNLADLYHPDAPRHFMNGVLIHDMIRGGGALHPAAFAKQYYAHYPAISLPYHPPLFPVFEAALFFVFGVDTTVARVAVTLTVIVSALWLYALVLELNGSIALAFLTTVTFFSLGVTRKAASDVMLEFPALALTLAALYCLRRFDREFTVRTGVLFALLGGAAVWTKQFAIALGPVPWILVGLMGRWTYLRKVSVWLFTAIFGFACISFAAIPLVMLRWAGQNLRGPSTNFVARHNSFVYFNLLRDRFFVAGLAVLVVGLLFACLRILLNKEGRFADCFYLAWMIPVLIVAIFVPLLEERYIMPAYPALIALGYLAIFRVSGRILGKRWAWSPVFAVAAVFCGNALMFRPPAYAGERQAAQFVAAERPGRILYCCGGRSGLFVAHLRVFDSPARPILFEAEKLPREMLTPAGLDEFAREYGFDHIVIEQQSNPLPPYEWLKALPTPNMTLEKDFPVAGFFGSPSGQVSVYRFLHPSPSPPSRLRIQSGITRWVFDLDLTGGAPQ